MIEPTKNGRSWMIMDGPKINTNRPNMIDTVGRPFTLRHPLSADRPFSGPSPFSLRTEQDRENDFLNLSIFQPKPSLSLWLKLSFIQLNFFMLNRNL